MEYPSISFTASTLRIDENAMSAWLDIRRQDKKDSKDDLQQAKQMIDNKDDSTDSAQHHLFGLGKHLDKVLNSCSDSARQLDEVQKHLSLFRAQKEHISASQQQLSDPWELQNGKQSLEEGVRQLLEENDQQGKQEKAKAYRSSCPNPGSADPDASCSEGRGEEACQPGRRAPGETGWKGELLREKGGTQKEAGEGQDQKGTAWPLTPLGGKKPNSGFTEEELEDTLQDKEPSDGRSRPRPTGRFKPQIIKIHPCVFIRYSYST